MNQKRAALKAAFPYTLPICAGFTFLGLAYGIYMNSMGFSFVYPMLMSLLIFAGSMEFVTVSLLVSSFHPLHAFLLEHRDLLQQYKRIHNDARPDDAAGIFVQHTRRKQMQDKLFPIDDYRVSGVVAPLETYDRICVLTEHIDDLSLSFIAPLGADDDST